MKRIFLLLAIALALFITMPIAASPPAPDNPGFMAGNSFGVGGP